jgi:hypothetical protein
VGATSSTLDRGFAIAFCRATVTVSQLLPALLPLQQTLNLAGLAKILLAAGFRATCSVLMTWT